MKIVWTEKADRQLNQIFDYIASDSTVYAYRTANKMALQYYPVRTLRLRADGKTSRQPG